MALKAQYCPFRYYRCAGVEAARVEQPQFPVPELKNPMLLVPELVNAAGTGVRRQDAGLASAGQPTPVLANPKFTNPCWPGCVGAARIAHPILPMPSAARPELPNPTLPWPILPKPTLALPILPNPEVEVAEVTAPRLKSPTLPNLRL